MRSDGVAGESGTPVAVRLGVRTALFLALALGALAALGLVDPVQLLLPGQKGAGGAVMVQDFGSDRVPDGYSYDGQQYYLAARYFPDVRAAGEVVGGPRFRLLRIGLPALASPAGEGTGLVVLLVALNIIGVGIAVGSLADLAQRHRRPPVVGVAAGVALATPLFLTTAECLAFGIGLLALDLAHRGHDIGSLAALAAAGLTRETALTFGIGILALWLTQRRFGAAAALPLTIVPLVLWRLYLVSVLPDGPDAPFGLFDVAHLSDRPTVDQVAAAAVLLLGAHAVVHWRDAVLLWPVAAAWLAWFAVYEDDTYDWRALLRVSAPLVALGLAGAASLWGTERASDAPPVERTREHADGC